MLRIIFSSLLLTLLVPMASAQAPRVLTIEEAVAIARTQAAAVQMADLEVDVRDAALAQARAGHWPSLQLSTLGEQRYGLAFDQTAGQLTQETIEFANLGLGASWTVFDGFQRRLQTTGARAERDAAQLRRVRAEQLAVHEALRLYYDVAIAEAMLDVVRANREAQEGQLNVVEAQIDAGIRPASEIFLQQERVAEAELQVLDALRLLRGAELRLVRHLGLDPQADFRFVAPEIGTDGSVHVADDIVEQAFSARPDLRAYGAALASAEADRRAAAGAIWPTLTLVGNVGTTYTSTRALDLSSQLTDNRSGLIRLNVSIPLVDQGQRRARSRMAEARLRQLEVEVGDRHREVAVEVLEAANELRVRAEEIEVAERRAVAASASLDAERDRYVHGISTLAAVAEASARHVEAEVRRAQARYALAVTAVLLDYRTGNL